MALALALGGWAWFSKAKKEQAEAIDRRLKETQELISRDSFGGYKAAAEKAQPVLGRGVLLLE